MPLKNNIIFKSKKLLNTKLKIILIFIIFTIFGNLNVFAYENKVINHSKNYVEGEVIVKYKNNKINLKDKLGQIKALNFIKNKSLRKREDIKNINTSIFNITDGTTVESKITELQGDPNVEFAQPNYQYYSTTINTDDIYKDYLWGLDNTGQEIYGITGTNNADINAPQAWLINEGTNSSVIVAVIDNGVAYNHPDLISNMWDGSNCKDENGSYLGGCNHGYIYDDEDIRDKKTPLPDILQPLFYHGTHIAGIIAAVKNNNKGVIGVAPNAKIMAIKSSLITSNIIKGINFAQQNGARIINASWGSTDYDDALRNRMLSFPGLFTVAAGNCGGIDYLDHDCSSQNQTFYPAAFDLDNIISVAATDQNDDLASFSNHSSSFIDVGAPGVNILSTITLTENDIDGNYGYMDGTSMAAPYVAGLAALIEGYKQNLTDAEVKNIILTTGDNLSSLSGKTVSGKRIDAQKALEFISPIKMIKNFDLVSPSVNGAIDEVNHTITINVPFGTDVTNLSPTIVIDGASVSPNTLISQDFTNPINYTVTALDGSTQIYIVTVNINPSDAMIVASDKLLLTDDLIKGTNPDLSNITTSLTNPLPSSGSNGAVITWVSNNTSIVSNDGQTITRLAFGTGNATINLTATLTKGAVIDTKIFTLIVLEQENPDISLVSQDKISLVNSLILGSNPDISNITTSLTNPLPSSGSNGSVITWVSSNLSVVSNDGQTITRPEYINGDASVTLTATLSKGLINDTKIFNLIILKNINPDISFILSDKSSITDLSILGSNPDISNITTPLTNPLPASGSNGSTITWVSSNTSIISNDGQTITRPAFGTGNATVNLTATLTKGEVIETKIFTLIVLADAVAPTLNSITITTPATKLSYKVGDSLDFTGLIVSGVYSDLRTRIETITNQNITGFDSSSPATNQVLTITVNDKTTTFTVNIIAKSSSGGGNARQGAVGQNGTANTDGGSSYTAPIPIVNAIRYLFKDQANKDIEYIDPITKNKSSISNICLTDDQSSNNLLALDTECKINVGNDLIVWTKYSIKNINNLKIVEIVNPVNLVNPVKNEIKYSLLNPISNFIFTITLRLGSKNNETKELQKILIDNGYLTGIADGTFGKETLTAVKKFQQINNLLVDGVIGPKARAILNKNNNELQPIALPPVYSCLSGESFSSITGLPCTVYKADSSIKIKSILKIGFNGSETKELQKILIKKGFLIGIDDGIFGMSTLTAVKNFQLANGLTSDGVVGPITVLVLEKI